MQSLVEDYALVKLANGAHSLRSLTYQETFHPVIGPVAEAEALYIHQLKLRDRMSRHPGEFVVWDIGLGAAANALTVIRSSSDLPVDLRLVSFDRTLGALQFALDHAQELAYFQGYEEFVRALLRHHHVAFTQANRKVDWRFHLADFPEWIAAWAGRRAGQDVNPSAETAVPAPHIIMFDAYSPARNAAMWSYPVFADLFRVLDPQRPCALATYSRSTLLRATLLLAGFYVGSGDATGEKEETTIAANCLDLLERPLGPEWLQRAQRSTSAEPLWDPHYRQTPLSPATRLRLEQHPQFKCSA